MKEGYKTTEFWVSIFASVMGIGVTTGYITPEQSTAMGEAATTIAGSIVTIGGALGYSLSRGLAKKQ